MSQLHTRQEFTVDSLFGMPVLRNQPGELRLVFEGAEDERFQNERAENCYQIWVRGAQHAAILVRRALDRLEKEPSEQLSMGAIRQALVAEGLCAKPPGG